jgi:hypothetical protein
MGDPFFSKFDLTPPLFCSARGYKSGIRIVWAIRLVLKRHWRYVEI